MEKSSKNLTLISAETEHLAALSKTSISTKSTKIKSKKTVTSTKVTTTTANECVESIECTASKKAEEQLEEATAVETTSISNNSNNKTHSDNMASKVKKEKRSRKQGKDHISLKSSLSKFDALQKRNVINNAPTELATPNCRLCTKPVYKMEEVNAERSVFHKTCFRCHECNKQLKVDNYQSDAGKLYCLVHFKLLFAPKIIEAPADGEPKRPSKPELIIRENNPLELPPDVVRSSDKPDLGLAELQQLNLSTKFKMFESNEANKLNETATNGDGIAFGKPKKLLHPNSFLTKLAILNDQAEGHSETANSNDDDDDTDNAVEGEDEDARLLRQSRRRTKQRERPIGLGHAMDDIKSRFEKGHVAIKEERREERKQELQNIRSRLFMGKQARIKEMYQQAVADSEQSMRSADKLPDIEVGSAARSIKESFETGEIFNLNKKKKRKQRPDDAADSNDDDDADNLSSENQLQYEADVFESAIAKQSRNIFMELDAGIMANGSNKKQSVTKRSEGANKHTNNGRSHKAVQSEVVKYNEDAEDVKIPTAEVSEKFMFFEAYRPSENQRKEFRITPPREGVVKMESPDETATEDDNDFHDDSLLQKSQTMSQILSKFRAIEKQESQKQSWTDKERRPLKCFTPPTDGGNRYYTNEDDEGADSEEDYDDEYECDDYEQSDSEGQNGGNRTAINDAALDEAKALARTKQLRDKFEKWEAAQELNTTKEDAIDIYSPEVSDNSNIESTKSIRQHFENLQHDNQAAASINKVRYQVNRFV